MKNTINKFLILLVLGSSQSFAAFAQDNSKKRLPLEDLSSFQTQAGNWQIVGEVTMNPEVDVHHQDDAKENDRKRKRKKRKSDEVPQAVTFQPGSGILLNLNDETQKDHLITNFEHGDIELELEVMLPKGSNSGLYLQGRYEIQLLDSWGVKNPKYSDMGGIYRNWETEPGKIYMGKAPLSNAAKAPGLWQHIKLLFKAPRFDESGNKIANARFVYVDLNGVRIHDNVEVPLPTGGPIENNEKPLGPIMIQGDHGPVAIRNFKYKLIHELDVSLSDLTYKVYHGDFKSFNDLADTKPKLTGKSKELTFAVAQKENAFGIIYEGKIHIPSDGTYYFYPVVTGGFRLIVDGQQLLNIDQPEGAVRNTEASVQLEKGVYPIKMFVLKNVSWRAPTLGLFVKKSDTYKVPLHAFSSNPPDEDNVPPVYVKVKSQPKLLRAFLDYDGKRESRITHSIGVGEPSGIHYVYDLKNGNLACIWRGDFVDATPMWHDRGDGSFKPMGAVQYLLNNQQLAVLADDGTPFPVKSDKGEFRSLGYEIEEATSRPVFKYRYKNINVKDRIYPGKESASFVREISLENPGGVTGLKYKLAEGKSIEQMPNGYYVIDKQYYIELSSGGTAVIREIDGKSELVLPVEGNNIKYSIIW